MKPNQQTYSGNHRVDMILDFVVRKRRPVGQRNRQQLIDEDLRLLVRQHVVLLLLHQLARIVVRFGRSLLQLRKLQLLLVDDLIGEGVAELAGLHLRPVKSCEAVHPVRVQVGVEHAKTHVVKDTARDPPPNVNIRVKHVRLSSTHTSSPSINCCVPSRSSTFPPSDVRQIIPSVQGDVNSRMLSGLPGW